MFVEILAATLIASVLLAVALSVRHYLSTRSCLIGSYLVMTAAFVGFNLFSEVGPRGNWALEIGELACTAVFLFHPYRLMRLVTTFRPVPRWIQALALMGAALGWAGLAVADGHLSGGLLVAAGILLLVLEMYAAAEFIAGGRNMAGATKFSMTAMATGTLLVGVFVLLFAIGGGHAAISDAVVGTAAIWSFYLAFSPSRWARRRWAAPPLNDFMRATVTTTPEPADAVLARLGHFACHAVGGSAAAVAFPAPGGGRFDIRWLRGGGTPTTLAPDGVVGRIWSTSGACAAGLGDLSAGERALAAEVGATHALVVTLAAQEHATGVLIVFADHGWLFADDDLQLLRELASHAAVVIDNDMLLAKTRRQAQRLAALYQLTASLVGTSDLDDIVQLGLSSVAGVIAAERGEVLLSGPEVRGLQRRVWRAHAPAGDGEGGAVASLTQGLPAKVLRSGKTQAGAGGMLAVPLRSGGVTIGVMVLARRGRREYSRGEIGLVEAMAAQITVALERGRLHADLAASEADLRAANAELVRASRAKSEFLAHMSHELRTPLNSILGFSELLLDGGDALDAATTREYLQMVHDSGGYLLGLINDILDMSKVEAGRIELDVVPTDVLAAVERAVAEMQPLADKGGLALSVEVGRPGLALADQAKLAQILRNLLANSIKFTPSGGRVWAEVRRSGRFVRVSVGDTGPGIPPDQRDRIFEQFHRLDRTQPGTGLGLALTRRLVELQGGRIWVKSEVGAGSVFTFTLPVAPAAAASARRPA